VNSKPVFALREVESDLGAAIAHYESWRPDGKAHVLRLYQETISWIEWNPDLFPKKVGRVQRAILKRSYYIVYFIQEPNRTIVLAVLDGRRKPSEIRCIVRRRKGGEPAAGGNAE
jgi:plasmid stabilization system protein ParE